MSGIAVEFCTTTSVFTERDRTAALAILNATEPQLETPPDAQFFLAEEYAAAKR